MDKKAVKECIESARNVVDQLEARLEAEESTIGPRGWYEKCLEEELRISRNILSILVEYRKEAKSEG